MQINAMSVRFGLHVKKLLFCTKYFGLGEAPRQLEGRLKGPKWGFKLALLLHKTLHRYRL